MRLLRELLGARSDFTGFLGDPRQEPKGPKVTISLNGEQAQQVEEEFASNPGKYFCPLDAAAFLFPNLVVYVLDEETKKNDLLE